MENKLIAEIENHLNFKKTIKKCSELFEQLISEYQIKKDRKKFPNSIFIFSKEGKCLFEIEKSVVWYSHDNFYRKFSEQKLTQDIDFDKFIVEMMETSFHHKVDTTFYRINQVDIVEKHFNSKVKNGLK